MARSRTACVACRRSKVKCDLDECYARNETACTRCAHLGAICEPHMPGPKKQTFKVRVHTREPLEPSGCERLR